LPSVASWFPVWAGAVVVCGAGAAGCDVVVVWACWPNATPVADAPTISASAEALRSLVDAIYFSPLTSFSRMTFAQADDPPTTTIEPSGNLAKTEQPVCLD